MRCVLLHYHIFKNAGSTVEEALARCFGKTLARLETSESEGLISDRELFRFLEQNPHTKAITSHQIRYPVPKAPGLFFLDLCLLRDPVDRVRSIYEYYHSRPAAGDPLSDLARGSIGEFVAGAVRDQQLHIKNMQVNYLACAGDSEEPEEKDFLVALERIRSAAFLGVVDCFNKSMVAGQYAIQPVFPELDCAQPAENVTGGFEGEVAQRLVTLRVECEESDYAELLRLNALDLRLVECARTEVERRFRMVPDAWAKLQQFERRISAPLTTRGSAYMRRIKYRGDEHQSSKSTRTATKTGVLSRLMRLARLPMDSLTIWLFSRHRGVNLFDAWYYRTKYRPHLHPLIDFLMRGAFEGKKPHPLFDPEFYLRKYADVAASGTNPLVHFLRSGIPHHRQPNPFFDPDYYLARNPDVRSTGTPSITHFIRHGAAEMRKPHPLFEHEYYARVSAGIQVGAEGLLAHFADSGCEAASPHRLFDCGSYLDSHPEVTDLNMNPLADYLCRASVSASRSFGLPSNDCIEAARFSIDDVPVLIAFQGDGWPRKTHQKSLPIIDPREADGVLPRSLVVVSKDSSGAVRLDADSQQKPFFEAIPVDQLFAQVNVRLAGG